MKLNLQFPCQEDLNKMPDTDKGKFCNQCSKEVIDFTSMSKEEVIEVLSKKRSCGIFRNDQLDKLHAEPLVHIRPRKNRIKSMVATITLFALALVGCNDVSKKEKSSTTDSNNESESTTKKECARTLGAPIPPKIEPVITEESKVIKTSIGDTIAVLDSSLIAGGIAPPTSFEKSQHVWGGPEIYAEFPGGEDSMINYLEKNITYPFKDSNVSGVVYAEFDINEEGYLENVKILRSLNIINSSAFDSIVINAIKQMPRWIPASVDGNTFRSSYTIPVKFGDD